MGKNLHYYYFVEGHCEKKLIEALKSQKNMIVPGKVDVFNVTQKLLSDLRLRALNPDTIVILIFDTDTGDVKTLLNNINILESNSHVKGVWCITQIRNFEDEIMNATDVRQIKEITGSKSNKDFKRDFISARNVLGLLQKHNFNYTKLWCSEPDGNYRTIINNGHKIKKV